MTDLHDIQQSVEKLIRKAGQQIAKTDMSPVHRKAGHYNLVTDMDVAIEDFLKRELLALLPGSCFFAEEQENEALTDAYTWVVDPIDGTSNFTRNRRASCVSVALMQDKKPLLGMVYNPYADEIFSAIRGEGAFMNGQMIHVTENDFGNALVAFGTSPYYAHLADATAHCFHAFLTRSGDLRRVGSAALDCCDLACGRADVFFEMQLSPWDIAAGALLIEEAGGIFSMPYETKTDFGKSACILAANPVCYDSALKIITEAKAYIKDEN